MAQDASYVGELPLVAIKKKVVVFFRGRSTAGIIADTRRHGILADGDRVVVICRNNDDLRETGDITALPSMSDDDGDVVVVANGGTTAQMVPVVARLVESAARADEASNAEHERSRGGSPRAWRLTVYDVRREGAATLVDM